MKKGDEASTSIILAGQALLVNMLITLETVLCIWFIILNTFFFFFLSFFYLFLAHLSRRLIGELIV